MNRSIRRRGVLAVGALVALALGVTACSSSGSGGGSGSSGAGGSGGSGNKSSINIGQVGAYTGQVPGLDGEGYGLDAWVQYTNAQGGIDGHKINLYKGDSKGDPTTEVSQIVQIATQHKVVAFAGMGTFNLASSASFIAQQKVAVIGGNISDNVWNQKPYLYPQGTANVPLTAVGFGHVPAGKTKTGVVYCKESPGCTQVYTLLVKDGLSKALGGSPSYSSEVSLAAPSFTAQCLGAKAAGVQTLAVAMDPVNLLRLATDCGKQGYKPTYVMGGTVASDALAKSANLEGAVAGQANAPWFLNQGPVATMRTAMAKYESGKTIDAIAMEGWTSGAVLGVALQNALKANGGKSVSRSDVLKGLGQIKADTFGGLTPPLTFTASGVQAPTYCYFSITVSGGKWTAPSGLKATCPTGSAKSAIEAAS